MKKICFLLLILIILLSSCRRETVINTPVPVPTSVSTAKEKPLVLSCIPIESELKLIEGWQLLADYITAQTGIPVEIDTKKSYEDIINGLKNGEVDMAYLGALSYIKAHDVAGVIPVVQPNFITEKEPTYRSCIIVRKDSGIKRFADLKGKKFAFTDKDSTSGYLIPVSMMADSGIKNLKFFSSYLFTGDHEAAFLAVYNGYVDGGAVYSRLFLDNKDPRLKDIIIIKKSEPIPTGPIVIRKEIPSEKIELIKKAYLSVGDNKETEEIRKLIKTSHYCETSDKDYDVIRKATEVFRKMGLDKK
ncbi:MAG: phosphate/phosphite/phosphonate ABC transporter substrate-binding protein [Candidatus Eremiobacterota bacterium]